MGGVLQFLAVCAAGAVGTGLRYAVSGLFARPAAGGFPWATLLVNLVGSALGGAFLASVLGATALSPSQRLVLTTGFLGGFTTYSAFNTETLAYVQAGRWGLAALYVVVMLAGGLLAGALGFHAATSLTAARL